MAFAVGKAGKKLALLPSWDASVTYRGGGVEAHWPEHKPLGEELMIITLSGSRGNGLLPRWRMRCLYLNSGEGSSLGFFQ